MLDFDRLPRFKKESVRILNLIDQWADAFQVSRQAVIRQLPIAHVWIESNPNRAPKTRMTRFLHTWMRRAKEWGTLKDAPKPNEWKDPAKGFQYEMTIEEMRAIKEANLKPKGAL